MTLTCRAARLRLPSIDDPAEYVGPLAVHMSSCLVCQAEAARYRGLQRSLGGLSDLVQTAPSGLVASVEARLSESESASTPVSVRAARAAAAAGAVMAAAGTVAMVRWMRARSAA
jgi:anti-sigma factor RsiW